MIDVDNEQTIKKLYESLDVIEIESLPLYFSKTNLYFLNKENIITLKDLFEFSESPEFITRFNASQFCEIQGSIRLLKTKFLNIDPAVKFSVISSVDILGLYLGFKNKAIGELLNSGITTIPDFLDFVGNIDDRKYSGISGETKIEVREKYHVVDDYYKKNKIDNVAVLNEQCAKLQHELDVSKNQLSSMEAIRYGSK